MEITNNVASLIPKKVSELRNSFFIPDYQRGYRWGRHNVRQLLNDIRDSSNVYYLQPVVVCAHNHRDDDKKEYDFDVIDGQQRLTTLFIIYKGLESIYNMMESNPSGFNFLSKDQVECRFTLSYQTRNDSEEFLSTIKDKTLNEAREFADYLYMYHAYQEVYSWFLENKSYIAPIAKSLKERVFIIWYEVNADEDKARQIFENLNIGKIRLTNAELVKAIFLSQTNSRISDEEQNVIGQQWDEIERRLHDKVLWSFLTKKSEEQYATRIELLFDMVAKKKDKERDEFYTFLYFDNSFGVVSYYYPDNEHLCTYREEWFSAFDNMKYAQPDKLHEVFADKNGKIWMPKVASSKFPEAVKRGYKYEKKFSFVCDFNVYDVYLILFDNSIISEK